MVVNRTIPVGFELPPVVKHVAQDDMYQFESVVARRGQNVHNDPTIAQAVGLSAPIASGMMEMAYIHELMEQSFGDGWTLGGKVRARWIHPVYAGDTLTGEGKVVDKSPEGDKVRVTVEISCTNQHGTRTAVGTASALVP